ncbi:RDD family protein [bacterium]|nr:RDD family protein [bacterium]
MHWYYADEGVQVGPLTDTEFEDLVRVGKVTDRTIVWHEGLSEWQPYRHVRPAIARPPSPPPISTTPSLRCTECHREFSQNELIRYRDSWICTTCKPIFFQRIREGVPIPGTMNYAGFWVRFGAKLIDGVIVWVVEMAAILALGPLFGFNMFSSQPPQNLSFLIIYPFLFAASIFYSVWFVGKYSATPGKMALGLKIVTSAGDPVSYTKALARFFAEMLSAIICYIGYFMAAFDDQKKALHDHICDTRVIRK